MSYPTSMVRVSLLLTVTDAPGRGWPFVSIDALES